MLTAIPHDPNAPEYRLGHTLGPEHTHWRRGKTGGGRYRLFFRFRSDARLIVFAWLNDEESLRDWEVLAAEASTAAARQRAAHLR